ncbi:hypothetical protein CYMTET_2797 [Cymbomonas tetramitiformis]|uniref:Amino acid transporter transmembrane domain-containing protein n=1 Tax=Cymbomonas tetramitiformis TaxID=36881 RepID=A0AAE0H4M1_9CHLO|nr:hypothetical protein CYMTET_2797 [Cymbomonas tetramitiformis]
MQTTRGGSATYNQALFNSVNILMGVGLLSIPYALSQGGWSAIGVLGLLWAMTNYTGKLIALCLEAPCRVDFKNYTPGCLPLETYEDIGEAAFGKTGRTFITAILYTELIGTCGLFLILEGDHLALLFPDSMSPAAFMVLSAAIILPTTYLADLSALSYVGLVGLISAIALMGVVLYDFTGNFPVDLSTTALLEPSSFPLTFGLLAFVFAGHAVFPSIYSSMEDQERYPEMLNTSLWLVYSPHTRLPLLDSIVEIGDLIPSMTYDEFDSHLFIRHAAIPCRADQARWRDNQYAVVGITCLVLGTAGYAMYGSNALEEVTMNLPSGPLATIATCLIVVNPFAKFALTMDPVARGLEEALGAVPSP